MDWFDKIAKRVRSPRGKMADKEAVYQELCQRIGIEQEAERSVALRPMLWRRVAAAACVVLVITIGVAGIYQYQAQTEGAETATTVTPSAPKNISPLAFDNQPLSEIAKELSKRFGTEVTVQDNKLAQYRMTATFPADESLPEILSALATAGHFHFCKTDRGYSLIP